VEDTMRFFLCSPRCKMASMQDVTPHLSDYSRVTCSDFCRVAQNKFSRLQIPNN